MTATMEAPVVVVLAGAGSRDPAALVAGGIPTEPPRDWFDFRDFPDGTPLTFTTDGQVYGRLANRNVSHVGRPGQRTRAPYSSTGFAYYHLGAVRCADGSIVNTGPITLGGGHASEDPSLTADAARACYDDANSGIADVVAWDRPDGVYCAGAVRPGVTPEKMRVAMASPASGDWRPIEEDGVYLPGPEFIAAHCVSVPGFPTRRSDGTPPAARQGDHALAASAAPPEGAPLPLVSSADEYPRIIGSRPDSPTDTPNQPEEASVSTPVTAASKAPPKAPPPFPPKKKATPKTPPPPPDDTEETDPEDMADDGVDEATEDDPGDGGAAPGGSPDDFPDGSMVALGGTDLIVMVTGSTDDGEVQFQGSADPSKLSPATKHQVALAASAVKEMARERELSSLKSQVASLVASQEALTASITQDREDRKMAPEDDAKLADIFAEVDA